MLAIVNYAVSVFAERKDGTVSHWPCVVAATDIEEAKRIAGDNANKMYPEEDGWILVDVSIVPFWIETHYAAADIFSQERDNEQLAALRMKQ